MNSETATPNLANPTSQDDAAHWLAEFMLCRDMAIGFLYFIETYCRVLSIELNEWIPFVLWGGQRRALIKIHRNKRVIILKARQVGLTWLLISYALWMMIFIPNSVVLFWSKRDDESTDLIENRLYKMWELLPPQLRSEVVTKNAHELILKNGSRAQAFPTTAGDSYTANLAVLDEFDLVEDQEKLLGMVEPTIGDNGKLVIISRINKRTPKSKFKEIWNNAQGYVKIFLAWFERPDRDKAWYDALCLDAIETTGTLDTVWEQYPATPDEALAPKVQDKAIPAAWLQKVYVPTPYLADDALKNLPHAPAINGLRVFSPPVRGIRYTIGVDTAEGNVNSDDSAATVVNAETLEEVAVLQGKFTPAVLGAHVKRLSEWYNWADVLVERNNHGHAVILWLTDNAKRVRLIETGEKDKKAGWATTTGSKTTLYDHVTEQIRNVLVVIHDNPTYTQLTTIEGATLEAPDKLNDDLAISWALAVMAASIQPPTWQSARPYSGHSEKDDLIESRLGR